MPTATAPMVGLSARCAGPLRSSLLATAAARRCATAALAHDGGEGWWGETNDKVVTNAGFILIAFFPLFIFT